MDSFYSDKMDSFYSDEKEKIVKTDLFDDIAKDIADGFVGEKTEKGKTKPYGVSSNQLRRLYDEVKRFDQKLDGTPGTWAKNLPYINKIKSIVCYNTARAISKNSSEEGVYKNLSKFIIKGLDKKLVKDEEDYHVFTALFEAVYGYYWGKNPERKREAQS